MTLQVLLILRYYSNKWVVRFLRDIMTLGFESTFALIIVFFAELYWAQAGARRAPLKTIFIIFNAVSYGSFVVICILSWCLGNHDLFDYADSVLFACTFLFLAFVILNYGIKLSLQIYEYQNQTLNTDASASQRTSSTSTIVKRVISCFLC